MSNVTPICVIRCLTVNVLILTTCFDLDVYSRLKDITSQLAVRIGALKVSIYGKSKGIEK
jgi:hypothetical protein